MQILPGLLAGIAILFLIVKPGDSRLWATVSSRIFLDPIDFRLGKKSCSDGYVHGIDHFILTGFINVTGYELGRIPALFSVWFIHRIGWWPIKGALYNLGKDECTVLQNIPPDQCRCQYETSIIIRLKCNLTAQNKYSYKPFALNLITKANSSCARAASTNGGTSSHVGYNGMPGLIFLVTALVCTVTSMVSNGQ
ncbi:unnamed protein product [Lymnaea stagnalis]|uniref:Uncharacterized protein n=1 Tax=Lymnaea stagnalis TaxID=6523 RepID=A0AAV2HI52_LYMST